MPGLGAANGFRCLQALPIAAQLHAPAAIAAAGVVLSGLLGANFAQVRSHKPAQPRLGGQR